MFHLLFQIFPLLVYSFFLISIILPFFPSFLLSICLSSVAERSYTAESVPYCSFYFKPPDLGTDADPLPCVIRAIPGSINQDDIEVCYVDRDMQVGATEYQASYAIHLGLSGKSADVIVRPFAFLRHSYKRDSTPNIF